MCPENLHKHIINLHVLIKCAWQKDQKFLAIFSIYTEVCFVTSSETPHVSICYSSPYYFTNILLVKGGTRSHLQRMNTYVFLKLTWHALKRALLPIDQHSHEKAIKIFHDALMVMPRAILELHSCTQSVCVSVCVCIYVHLNMCGKEQLQQMVEIPSMHRYIPE